MSRKICRLEEGTIFSHWKIDYLLENLPRKNHENVVYKKLKHLDDVIFRLLVYGVRVFLYKVGSFVTQNKIFVSAITVFKNEGVPNDTSESAFQFIVRNSCTEG